LTNKPTRAIINKKQEGTKMREYTIRLYLDTLVIIEYNITAKNMFVAEDEAFRKFTNSGVVGRITYLSTIEKSA